MPDSNGALTNEERKKIENWMNEKGKTHKCPVCDKNEWAVGAHLLQASIYTPETTILGGPSYPLAFIVCINCAYTRKFMAVEIGLVKKNSDNGGERE